MIARRSWERKGPLQILSIVASILAVFFGLRVFLSEEKDCDEKKKEKMKPE